MSAAVQPVTVPVLPATPEPSPVRGETRFSQELSEKLATAADHPSAASSVRHRDKTETRGDVRGSRKRDDAEELEVEGAAPQQNGATAMSLLVEVPVLPEAQRSALPTSCGKQELPSMSALPAPLAADSNEQAINVRSVMPNEVTLAVPKELSPQAVVPNTNGEVETAEKPRAVAHTDLDIQQTHRASTDEFLQERPVQEAAAANPAPEAAATSAPVPLPDGPVTAPVPSTEHIKQVIQSFAGAAPAQDRDAVISKLAGGAGESTVSNLTTHPAATHRTIGSVSSPSVAADEKRVRQVHAARKDHAKTDSSRSGSPAGIDLRQKGESPSGEEASLSSASRSEDSHSRVVLPEIKIGTPATSVTAPIASSQIAPHEAGMHSEILPKSAATQPGRNIEDIQADAGVESAAIGPLRLNTAHLVDRVGQSEMRVGIHSGEFGNIEVRTSLQHEHLQAHISVDHPAVGAVIAAELPELNNRLHDQQVFIKEVVVSSSGNAGSGDRHSNPNAQQWQHPSTGVASRMEEMQIGRGPLDDVSWSSRGLDVRA